MKKLFHSILTLLLLAPAAWAGCGMKAHGAYAGGGGGCSMLKAPLFLLFLALGYWLLRNAEKETVKILKYVGRTVSWLTLVVALGGLLCSFCGSCRKGKHACGDGKPAGMMCATGGMKAAGTCPFTPGEAMKADAPAEAPAAPKPEEKK